MNSNKHLFSIVRLARVASKALLVCCLLQTGSAFGQNVWNGSAGTTNWSTPGNWSFGSIPTSGDIVQFDNIVIASPAAVVDNIVDAPFTIYGLSYGTVSTNGFHTTLLPAGLSLNINSSGGNAIFVGSGISLNTESVYSRFVGPGTLTVTNTAGAITVVQGGANNDHRATLDLSGLTNFSASLDQLLVGALDSGGGVLRPMGGMLFAETNFLQTAAGTTKPGIMVAAYPGSDTNVRGTQQLFLGRHNVINSDVISMGGHKSVGQILFRSGMTGGYASFRGSAGGADKVKLLTVGDTRARINDLIGGGTGSASTGTFDTTGNFLDLSVVDLIVPRSQTNGNGVATGTLTLDQGVIDADNLYIGFHPSPASQGNGNAFNAVGTMNVNGTAVVTVNNDLVLARKAGTNIPTATVNLSASGTLNVKGNVVTSGGTSTINFNNGGTINMQPAGDATPGNLAVSGLNGSGSIINAANVTNTASLTPGTATIAGTLAIGGSFTLSSNATLNINLANVNTVGANVNDLVSVTGNLILNSNVISLVPLAPTLAVGSYRLFDYTGTQTGFLNFTNPTRYNLSLDYATPGQINLVNSGGSPASLTWKGSTNGNWNTTTTNWNNNTDRFNPLDSVTFDDTGAGTNVALVGTLYPNVVTVNAGTNYFFTGSGKISGGASLTKSGTGILRVATANDFTGPVTISGGIFQMGNATALGTTNSGTTVTSGGTLDVNNISFYSPGELVTIAGTGLNSTGAVINTGGGAGQNNAIRFLTLSDNASVRSDYRFDVRGPGGNSSFSGALNLNGFTLTKFGAAQMSLVDAVVTNAGTIEIAGGVLSMTRSLVDGPGYINISSNALFFENFTTGYVAKPFSVAGGLIRVTGGVFTYGMPITNLAGVTMDNGLVGTNPVSFILTNTILGAGGLTKSNTGTLLLDAANTYAGPTTITAGAIKLGTNGSIASTPSISMFNGAIFDASSVPGGFVLGSGQTLSGSGSVLGDVTAGSGTGVVPGTSAGTLTFSNQLTLTSSSNVFELSADPTQIGNTINDLLLVNSNLTLSGVSTVKIVPLASLNNASPYTLFQYTGTLTGNEANLAVGSDSRYAFVLVPTASTPGFIQVNVSGSGTSASLVWKGGNVGNPTAWDTKVTTNWLNGVSMDAFYLGDNVLFDDSALTNRVTVPATVRPAVVVLSNNTVNYTVVGPGSFVAGSLDSEGSGTFTFSNSAPNTVAAGFTNNAGTVTFANTGGNTLGAAVTINAGTVNFFNAGANSFVGALNHAGSGALTFANGAANLFSAGFTNDAGTVTFANISGNTFVLGATINAGTVNFVNPVANAFSQPLFINGGLVVFDQPADVTFSQVVSDNGSGLGTLEKRGANTLTLSGNNVGFNGPIFVNAGTLKAQNANALGTAVGGTTVANGASLDVNGSGLYTPGDLITIAGNGVGGAGAIFNSGGAQNNAIRAVTLTANASIGAAGNRWDVRGPGGAGSFSGAISLGGFTLTKLGAARISVVDAVMTDPGSVEVVAGTLAFTRTSVDGTGYLNIGPNVLLLENYSTAASFTKPLIFNGGLFQVTGNAIAITSPITNLAALTLDLTANLTVQATITGPGSLTKIGGSTLILAETNDYTGGTFISAGGVQIGLNGTIGNLPPQPGGVLTNNGTLIFNRADDLTFSEQITGTGGVQQIGGGTVFLTVSNSYSGQTLVNTTAANSPGGAAMRISHPNALGDTNGNTRIQGDAAANGRLEIVGNITVAEPLFLDARQGASLDIPTVLNVSGNNTLTGSITGSTGGSDYNIQSDSGKLTVTGNFVPPNNAGTRRLKLMGDSNGEWSGVISNSLNTLVAALVAKTGLGTWTLSGSNVYLGSTTIRAGTLALAATGSINNTPTIDVQTSATFSVAAIAGGFVLGTNQTLMGSGTVMGNVTANGTVSPGASIGTLTFANNLVLAGTNVMEIDRDGTPTNADLIVANGLTYGGTLTVNNLGLPLQNGDTFNLFDATSIGGTFAATNLPALDPGLGWDLSNLSANGTIKVVTTVSTTPTNLTFQVVGNTLDISWPSDHTGWRLESQTNAMNVGITTNWFTVPASAATNRVIMDIDRANGTVFFRLIYP